MSEVPEHIREKLKRYFTDNGDTFVIMNLPAELSGALLARYSRTPTGIQLTLANEFLDENGNPCQGKGSELIDRVLNAYGDDSVGEFEGVHVGIENVSNLVTKTVEDRRIGGSPIEKSTRYIRCDEKDEQGRWRYLRPKEIIENGFLSIYEHVNDRAFEVYSELVKRLQDYFRKKFPENDFEIDVERECMKRKAKKHELANEQEGRAFRIAYDFTIRCAALDVGRCVLPASTLTQFGVYGNGRYFTNVINALKASELEEERQKGYELEIELKKIIPTFIKRNRETDRQRLRNKEMRRIASNVFFEITPTAKPVTLLARAEYIDEIITGILYPHTNVSAKQILDDVKKMSYKQKQEILKSYVGERETRRDRTPRGIEAGYPITFDLVGCFSEYRDLQRHRMLTQQRQMLTTDLGFLIPPEITEVGMENEVEEVANLMHELNKKLKQAGLLVASQYATLFNHRLRFSFGMNLREAQHFFELRTQPAGHYSYRAMTMQMADELKKRYEWSSVCYNFTDYSDADNRICRAKEQARIAGKNIAKGIDGGIDL